MVTPITYYGPFAPENEITRLYKVFAFLGSAPWERRTSARLEAFWSTSREPYTYGKGAGVRSYFPHEFPAWMIPLKVAVSKLAGREMHLCFVNRYDTQHDHLGWHADDSPEQDDDAPIIVQSFGAERELWFRENGRKGAEFIHKQLLEDRSTLIMHPGMQQTHQHRIPKHPEPIGTRVSLTWRALLTGE